MPCNCVSNTLSTDEHVKMMKAGDTAKIRVRRGDLEATVEGVVYNSRYIGSIYYTKMIGPYGLADRYGNVPKIVVEVLDHVPGTPPRPKEPEKLGSVVFARRGTQIQQREFVKVGPMLWFDTVRRYAYGWDSLKDIELR